MLIAVDGSKHSLDTVKYAIQHARWYRGALDVELLYVQPPLPYEGRAGAVPGNCWRLQAFITLLIPSLAR